MCKMIKIKLLGRQQNNVRRVKVQDTSVVETISEFVSVLVKEHEREVFGFVLAEAQLNSTVRIRVLFSSYSLCLFP